MIEFFKKTILQFKEQCLDLGYNTILEADVCGWLFHIILNQTDIEKNELHLDTRIKNSNERVDLAIGNLKMNEGGRPYVEPRMVVEVKLFPTNGFTAAQHSEHYNQILKRDLPKLARIDSLIEFRVALIVDGNGYLNGNYKGHNRLDFLVERRNQIARGVCVCILSLINSKWDINYIS